MLLTRLPAAVIIVLSCLVGMLFAQTFQYSRGWTNGRKRSSLKSPREIDCQLQRLRAIIEGKSDQLYWPCAWQNFPENIQHSSPPAVPPALIVENPEDN
ncbi:corazonin [Lycorma delicatula]|uniref:corazonin n=1 Tax=Lycorma delicatula TaxID=130591 RepID=UPI003F5130EA